MDVQRRGGLLRQDMGPQDEESFLPEDFPGLFQGHKIDLSFKISNLAVI